MIRKLNFLLLFCFCAAYTSCNNIKFIKDKDNTEKSSNRPSEDMEDIPGWELTTSCSTTEGSDKQGFYKNISCTARDPENQKADLNQDLDSWNWNYIVPEDSNIKVVKQDIDPESDFHISYRFYADSAAILAQYEDKMIVSFSYKPKASTETKKVDTKLSQAEKQLTDPSEEKKHPNGNSDAAVEDTHSNTTPPNQRLLLFGLPIPAEKNYSLYLANESGNKMNLVHTNVTSINRSCAYNGTSLAYIGQQNGYSEVFVKNINGTTASADRLTYSNEVKSHPCWSRDGSKIAYILHEPNFDSIYTTNPDGSGSFKLNFSGAKMSDLTWSPDGARLAFTAQHPNGTRQIYTVAKNGADLILLTRDIASNKHEPIWGINGAIYYIAEEGDIGHLYRINNDGSTRTRLTSALKNIIEFSISNAGTKISYVARSENSSTAFELHVMTQHGTNDQLVLTGDEYLKGATISPDGEKIAYIAFGNTTKPILKTMLLNGQAPPQIIKNMDVYDFIWVD